MILKRVLICQVFFLLAAGCDTNQFNDKVLTTDNPAALDQNTGLAPAQSASLGQSAVPSQTAIPAITTGLAGTIVLTPACPAQKIGQICERPYKATVNVMSADGKTLITSFTSDSSGNFSIVLKRGTYLLLPLNGSALPTANSALPRGIPQAVNIFDNQMTTVKIEFDSGIR